LRLIPSARLYEEVKLLSENLRVEEQRLRKIVDQMPQGLIMIDKDKKITQANPEAKRHLENIADVSSNNTLKHIGGRPIEQFFSMPEGGMPHVVELEGPPRRVYEIESKTISGRNLPHDRILIVNERTAEHNNREQAQLQERLAAVGRLAAGIAHDFNNILTGIIGFAQYLQTRPDIPDYAKDHLNKIGEQGIRAADLIQQILDFSRQSIVERSQLNLVPFIKEFHKFLRRTIPENITIELITDAKDCWVYSNPTQIQQIITNLAANACDAMPKGGKLTIQLSRIRVEKSKKVFEHSMPAGEWILLSVSDSGTGISKNILPHIFDPFFTTKEVGQGSGLGLAQVYGIVQQNDGHIDVESRVGSGSTFYTYLPATAGQENRKPEDKHETPKGKGETVLIVEDEPDVLEVVRLILDELDYKTKTASNGKEALDILEQNPKAFSLVVTDMVMPEMGGSELGHILKQKYPSMKVIIMSGYPVQKEAESIQAAHFDGWLQKPVSVDSVAKILSSVLYGKEDE